MKHLKSLALVTAMSLPGIPFAASAAPSFTPDSNLERSKVPDLFKWNLTPLFANDTAFEKALGDAERERAAFKKYVGTLSEPKMLRECLDLYFKERLATHFLTLYSQLQFSTDSRSPSFKAMDDRALGAMNDFMIATGFIRQELVRMDDAAFERALKAEPKLKEYASYIQEIRRRRDHVLSPEAERVLALMGDNLWAEIDLNELPTDHEKTYKAAMAGLPLPVIKDEEGKDVQLTLSNYARYRASKSPAVRRAAVEALFGTLEKNEGLFASTLSGQVNSTIGFARARGYQTALDAYLGKDNLDTAVYRNLISAIHSNLAPLHRYMALRKKVLGLDEMRLWDLYTPMIEGKEPTVTWEEARKLLPVALKPLGKEYVAGLTKGLDPASGWLDLYPNKGKRSGAFCVSTYGVNPYVAMNYQDSMDDLSTLAHEYGHAMHTVLSSGTQPYPTANYTMFIAEIASTMNEKLLSDHMRAKAKTREEKLVLISELVEGIRTTMYRQTMFAEFELAIHTAAEQGTPLTSEFLRKTYGDIAKHYYGPELTVAGTDDMEWAYVPHFYYKYYVYSYATGIASAMALAEKVQTGGAAARDAYLGMLKGGSSKPPLELLKGAGVDLTKPDAIVSTAKLMDRLVGEMEQLINQPQARR